MKIMQVQKKSVLIEITVIKTEIKKRIFINFNFVMFSMLNKH